jgi:signal transduction histidine kinase
MSFVPERAVAAGRPLLVASAAAVAVFAIAVVDYLTGPSLSMSAFYIIPVAVITALVGRRSGYLVTAMSGIAAAVSDVVLPPHFAHRVDESWNVGFMVCTLVLVVELVYRMRQQTLAARAAERQSREFVAYAAHQLRTPLATIRSTAEALVVCEEDDRERLLSGIARESARGGRLVASLLRVARLDQGEPLPMRAADLVDAARAEVRRAMAIWPGLAWCLDAPDGRLESVCNAEAIGEALAALIDNAHRHARSGVVVSLSRRGPMAELAVRDDGRGLPADRVRAAFQRFVSLDGHGGSGLGLPIASGIAVAHGGSLAYEDGAFVLRLPLIAGEHPGVGEQAAPDTRTQVADAGGPAATRTRRPAASGAQSGVY